MIRLFALSDPHLSHARPKPMDVFGPLWDNHVARIGENWRSTVGENDIVLMPGDISWAMRLGEAVPDLEWLAALPGRKVLLRGNHDYWWSSVKKMQALGLPNLFFVHNNSIALDRIAIGGSRLWDFPYVRWFSAPAGDQPDTAMRTHKQDRPEDPEKIRAHEIERLRLSLSGLSPIARYRVAMTHYPPLGENGKPTPLTDCIGEYNIDVCVFGHIHTPADSARPGEDCTIGKTRYVLTSSDHLGHRPKLLAEFAD